MFAVIFVVQPKPSRFEEYLVVAKGLKPELEKIDGFIDNERFASTRREGRVLSLSTWRDEKAVIRWRTHAAHHAMQEKGRFEIFDDYHLRVGEILADTQIPQAQRAPQQRFDETEIADAKCVTISELSPLGDRKPHGHGLAAALGLPQSATEIVDQEVFESLYHPGKWLLLVSWHHGVAADQWTPTPGVAGELRHRHVRIIRDYGMADRREAPQYYPPVPAAARGSRGAS
jgi:heme-degrading monooxygenase HmoA